MDGGNQRMGTTDAEVPVSAAGFPWNRFGSKGLFEVFSSSLRLIGALLFAVVVFSRPAIGFASPNIVFVMADDLGWSDTSNSITNMGNPSDYYETPTIDRLAQEGMAFTSAYANHNCAPTRAAILTGQYAPRPTNNVYQVNSLNRGGSGTLLVGPSQGLPSGTDAIPNSAFTYAENLQSGGYTTAHFGKFHVVESGSASSDIVSFMGFDENYGGNTNGGPGSYHANSNGVFGGSISSSLDAFGAQYTQQYVDDNIKPFSNGASTASIDALVGTNKHVSDALADAAIDFMEREKDNPFLVQFNAYAVHTPIGNSQARDDLLNKYQNKAAGSQDSNASFGALIEGLDQSVARLMDYLETTPDPANPGQTLDENTLVIFYSDNGGRQSQSNNGPLRGQKGELDEGGIRVPMIAWSGNSALVDGGTVNDTPIGPIDFYKTFAGLTGTGLPNGVTLDGEDLTGVFADATADLGRDSLYWHLPGYLVDGARNQRPQSVIRSDNWKLLYNYVNQSFELYDLDTDISESNNVADSNPALVADLGQDLMEWLVEVDAPLATLRSGSLQLDVNGSYYANGAITNFNGTLSISAGQEVPLILDTFLPNDLTWFGRDSSIWDELGSANNFVGSTGFTFFRTFDNVTFNDSAFVKQVVISSDVRASSLVVEGASTYTFTGAGGIVEGSLNVNGGSLELANTGNSYSGATTVTSGTLIVTTATGTGTTSVALGAILAGSGVVQGDLVNAGEVRPGNSAGTLSILGNAMLESTSLLSIELGVGSQDLLAVTGNLQLGGELSVTLIDGLTLTGGETFDILDFGSVSGAFDSIHLPTLPVGLFWDTSILDFTGQLIVASGIQGDFDSDSDVDGQDYLLWQRGFGMTSGATSSDGDADLDGDVDHIDLALWRVNYGTSLVSVGSAVPEPGSVWLALCTIVLVLGDSRYNR